MAPHSYEAAVGWHYEIILRPGEPVLAYKGVAPGGIPTGEAVWYPAPPGDAAPAATATAAGAAPNPPPAHSPNLPMLKTPGQVGIISIPQMPYIWNKTDWWLQQLGVVSPDGSPMTITDIRSDPPSFGTFRGTNGAYTQFDLSNAGQKGQATLHVTVQNASGTATIPITLQTGG